MQTFTPLSETRRACRLAAERLLDGVDAAYDALPVGDEPDLAAADAIDKKLAAAERQIWDRLEGDALGLTLFADLAMHLRDGGEIRHAQHEPVLAQAATAIRAARIHGACDQTRVDGLAAEMETLIRTGRSAFALLGEEIKKFCLMRDLAQCNQKANWLRRCQSAHPGIDLHDLIRDCERKTAAAKLAHATHCKATK